MYCLISCYCDNYPCWKWYVNHVWLNDGATFQFKCQALLMFWSVKQLARLLMQGSSHPLPSLEIFPTDWCSGWNPTKWVDWPRLNSQWQITNRHMFSWVFWGAESEFVVHCSQKRLQTISSSSPRPIIVIRSIWILTFTAVTARGVMPFYLEALRMQILQRDTVKTLYLVQNWAMNMLVKVSDLYDTY